MTIIIEMVHSKFSVLNLYKYSEYTFKTRCNPMLIRQLVARLSRHLLLRWKRGGSKMQDFAVILRQLRPCRSRRIEVAIASEARSRSRACCTPPLCPRRGPPYPLYIVPVRCCTIFLKIFRSPYGGRRPSNAAIQSEGGLTARDPRAALNESDGPQPTALPLMGQGQCPCCDPVHREAAELVSGDVVDVHPCDVA